MSSDQEFIDVPLEVICSTPANDQTPASLARTAVKLVLGTDNTYLQKLLEDRIKGINKKYKSVPIIEIFKPQDYSDVEDALENSILVYQSRAIDTLTIFEKNALIEDSPVEVPQDVSKWVIDNILDEKLKYRKVREKSDKWKIINGILAIVLPIITPIITGLLQKYLTKTNCS